MGKAMVVIGVIVLGGLLLFCIGGMAWMGIDILVITPISNGHLPLAPVAEHLGVDEKTNFVTFLVVFIPAFLIVIGINIEHYRAVREAKKREEVQN